MGFKKISLFEWLVLFTTAILLAIGLYTSLTDKPWFEQVYAIEDGIVEWLTLVPLVISLTLVFYRLFKNWRKSTFLFKAFQLLLGLFLFFVIGEEVSWGMRLFNLELTEFFNRYNNQHETNLHNLEFNGVSINIWLFSRLIIVAGALYLLVFPVLYRRWQGLKHLADTMGVPVPRLYQIIGFFVVFGLIGLIPSGKRAEILELGSCFMFMLVVYNPLNKAAATGSGSYNSLNTL
jgi:hypothetical protein